MGALESLRYFRPELFLLAGAFITLFLDLFIQHKRIIASFAFLVLVGAGLLTSMPEQTYPLFFGFFRLDTFTFFFRLFAFCCVGIAILMSISYKELPDENQGEYYSFFLLMAFALTVMAAASNLLMIFMAIEFVSLLSYILVGFLKKSPQAKEAAIKYLLYGSMASGTMLFGMSLIFGASGSLELDAIKQTVAISEYFGVSLVAFLLFVAGLGFKISMAPFHMWAPDIYEAAPTPVTAFLTVAPKALGFAVLIRLLSIAFYWLSWKWSALIIVLSILTMTLGNVIALSQINIKRLLAYSSIAQAGYILMGVAAFNKTGLAGVLIYLVAYAFTNLGAFTVVIMVSNLQKNDYLNAFAGLSKRSPFLAASLTIFLLSLAGIPPLAGFIGKFYVFASVIEAGFITLAIAAAVNSVIAAYYYFKIVRMMYLVPADDDHKIQSSVPLTLALFLMLTGTVLLGVLPGPFINFIQGILII